MVFVETINLDGESNLKPRTIIDSSIKSWDQFNKYSARLENYDAPNKDLEKWEGTLWNGEKTSHGHIENLLLRGCTLRNTSVAYGVVIYVGRHTKIVKNSKHVPDKLSNMIKTMNWILYSVFILQFCLMIIFASCSVAWKKAHNHLTYVKETSDDDLSIRWYDWILQFLLFYSDYAIMIPISLYVMIELLKIILASWIWSDKDMEDERG